MARIGYHASHEQYAPGELLRLVRRAEQAGFGSGMCSDHFHPWGETQGHSGFAWSWLGAALQATSLSFGVVTVPGGWRYSPAIIAQAAATLAEMYPGRFWIAPGSGELLNEGITGQRWPTKAERNARLREGVDIIRALWTGETVTHHGLITVEEARIYSLPKEPPRIVGAALSPQTAEWMGGWADGMITVVGTRESMQGMIDAFRRGGGEGKPIYLQAQLSCARTEEEALHGAWEQWRTLNLPSPVLSDLRLPSHFDAAGASLSKEDVKKKMRVSADVEQHLEWLAGDVEMGFEEINLHCVHRDQQERFIDVFGERVLPRLAKR
ncbi:TIGR03885 family FMN-dependent LLM class oxidoreductase [Longimicrobium sp.]|uniref:TIGR03885 family FMN-dependent LLM class oxidoreductase n=1 Tax=Longimicrobium sp. TaxID=2029185 RepID=UPI003B3AD905